MQVNVAGLRRNIKNLAHNYSDAQVKVREATSNDPWGPSSTLMAEIADLTYNVVAFTEIMQMIWKRLNDHGRNWRHVYKALVLLEYLIKTGTEKVSQQCRENIFAIQTLKDFQYLEEGKDQGVNVREKAKQLFSLLKDDERLRNERARALKAKERFAQTASGFGSDGQLDTPTSPKYPTWEGRSGETMSGAAAGELETARPQTAGEEELQLQLALAMSREEAEQDAARRRSDQLRLQLALSQSQTDFQVSPPSGQQPQQSHVLDLLDVNLGETEPVVDAWGASAPPITPPRPQLNKTTTQADPWSVSSSVSPPLDPWAPINNAGIPAASAKPDPWAPVSALSTSPNPQPDTMASPLSDLDEFDIITNRNTPQITNGNTNNNNKLIESNTSPDPFDFGVLNDTLPSTMTASSGAIKKTPQSFLGENSALVNLDNLVTKTTTSSTSPAFNPFAETIQPKPTINQIKQPFTNTATQQPALDPWAPVPTSTNTSSTSPWPNPFLS